MSDQRISSEVIEELREKAKFFADNWPELPGAKHATAAILLADECSQLGRELDAMIERWGEGCRPIKSDDSEEWWAKRGEDDIRGRWFPTRREAIHYAVGLNAEE